MFTSRLNVLQHLVNVANKPKFIQLFGHIPKHALERIVFKESLVSVPRLINNTLIFLVLMLTALAIKLRWYAELLSSSSQNLKTYPTISAKCSIQIKINLSSRFDMIWCSPEARGRNTARTTTQEQSSRLNCAMFRLCHGMRSRKMSLGKISAQPHTSLCIQSFVRRKQQRKQQITFGTIRFVFKKLNFF